ncbi:unnamed protein product [Effrenium voratum]|nr:unnamed protein product [Effrenium voratum]
MPKRWPFSRQLVLLLLLMCGSRFGFVTIHSLHRYPVKSCLGEELASAELVEEGILGDRSFVVESRGRALTQREVPALARIAARLAPQKLQMAFEEQQLEVPVSCSAAWCRTRT